MTGHEPVEDTMTLADGRILSYSKWGPADAAPVFYFHGFPSSHHELELTRATLERNGLPVRVITLDRPGFGTSTFQPDRDLLDWPSDVAEVADRFALDRFAVLGVSAGGPYALACAHALPHRVARAGVVAGLAPLTATGMNQAPIARTSRNRWIRRLQFAMAAYAINNGRQNTFTDQALAMVGEADRRALTQPETLERFVAMTQGAFAQGGKAAAQEAGLFLQPWGFNPANITVPTSLWYGGVDDMVPADAGRWLADRIPGADYTHWPQHGHFTWTNSNEAARAFAATAATPPGTAP